MESQDRRHPGALLSSSEPVTARLGRVVPEFGARSARGRHGAQQSYAAEVAVSHRGERRLPAPHAADLPLRAQIRQVRCVSRAALESLAIVAYRQPVTRAEIEHVRGVDVGPILRGLIERKLVRIAGHRDVPGRPILYATTRRFLEVFGLPTSICRRSEIEELLRDRLPDGDDAADATVATDEGAAAIAIEDADAPPQTH
jgi:chromosome segregation and condensation protein ScpB